MEIETSLRTTMNENPIYSPTIFNLHIPFSMAAWEQAKFNLEGLPMYLSPLRRCQLTSPVSGLRMKALAFFFDPLRYWRNSASRRSLPTVSESQMTVSCFLARVIATFSLLLSLKIRIYRKNQAAGRSIPQKSDNILIVGPDHGQDDGLLLPPLEPVHGLDLEVGELLL